MYIGVSAAVRDIPSADEYEIGKCIKSTPTTKIKRAMLIACDSFEVIIMIYYMVKIKFLLFATVMLIFVML